MKNKDNMDQKEARQALDSIKKMEQAGLKRILPIPRLQGAVLAILIGIQIALLGAGIRTYNTINIILILIMAITIINHSRSAGVIEKMNVSKQTIIILIVTIIATYFIAIIAGQYLKIHFGFNWAPYIIGLIVVVGFYTLINSTRRSIDSRTNNATL